jgi:predicted metal-binding membrane protein
MRDAAPRLDPWLVVLASTCLAAWSMLALDGGELVLPAFCAGGKLSVAPLSVSFDLALAFNTPLQLASGWALMLAAMMSPLTIAPLRHVRDRSFASRRGRAMLLFVAGYMAVWMTAGTGLQAVALAVRWAVPAPPVCLGLALAVAMVWQVSPAKQWCLNRCHRRPELRALGAAADHDAFTFGLTNGVSCAGACWALMLLPLVVGRGHLLAMIAISLFVFAERLENAAPLTWRWRGVGKALRIATAQARMRLARRKPDLGILHRMAADPAWLAKYRRNLQAASSAKAAVIARE